jgi:hypothetical protein
MKKQILIYGLIYGICGGLPNSIAQANRVSFLVVEHSVEIYGGLIALFAGLGIWLGLKLTRRERGFRCKGDFSSGPGTLRGERSPTA